MNNSHQTDPMASRRRHSVVGELTGVTPPSNIDRLSQWYPKALRAGVIFLTGDRHKAMAREYERQAIGTATNF